MQIDSVEVTWSEDKSRYEIIIVGDGNTHSATYITTEAFLHQKEYTALFLRGLVLLHQSKVLR